MDEDQGFIKSEKPVSRMTKIKEFFKKIGSEISDWWYWNKEDFIAGVILSILGIGLLGGFHHLGYAIHMANSDARSKGVIEQNISEQDNSVSNIAMDDISVSERDGKKILDIYGSIQLGDDHQVTYGYVSYEINDELFAKLQRYVRPTFEYNSFGEPVKTKDEPRVQKPLDAWRGEKVYYEALLEIREIVKNQHPISINLNKGGAQLIADAEAE